MKSADSLQEVFYAGEVFSIEAAGAQLVRDMIEREIPIRLDFNESVDPYSFVGDKLNKSSRTIRGWGFDWSTSSGNQPQIADFIRLCILAQSQLPIEFFRDIADEATPKQKEKITRNVLKVAANNLQKIVDTLKTISEK